MYPYFWASCNLYSWLPGGCVRRIMGRTMRLLLGLMGKHTLIWGEVDSMLEYTRELGWVCFICLSKMYVPLSLCPVLDLYGLHHRGPLSFSFWVGLASGEAIGRLQGGREEMRLWYSRFLPWGHHGCCDPRGKVTAPVTFLPSVLFSFLPPFLNIWMLSFLSSLS